MARTKSTVFGSKTGKINHFATETKGVLGEVNDLRNDVEEAFFSLDTNAVRPNIYSVSSDKADKVATNTKGIADDADSTLTFTGVKFDLGKGHDSFSLGGADNSSCDIYATGVGHSGYTFKCDAGASSYDATTKLITVGGLTKGASTLANFKTAVEAEATISPLIAVIQRGNGAGTIPDAWYDAAQPLLGACNDKLTFGAGNATTKVKVVARAVGKTELTLKTMTGAAAAGQEVITYDSGSKLITIKLHANSTALQVVTALNASTAVKNIILAVVPGTGAGQVGVNNTAALTGGTSDTDTMSFVAVKAVIGGTEFGTDGSLYAAAPSATSLVFKVTSAQGAAIGAAGVIATAYLVIDGIPSMPVTIPIVDNQ